MHYIENLHRGKKSQKPKVRKHKIELQKRKQKKIIKEQNKIKKNKKVKKFNKKLNERKSSILLQSFQDLS
jgi:hypothetical protein